MALKIDRPPVSNPNPDVVIQLRPCGDEVSIFARMENESLGWILGTLRQDDAGALYLELTAGLHPAAKLYPKILIDTSTKIVVK
jgi:hypothetical protein